LIAEEITSRFYNVIHLLSLAVPVIGIQVNIVEVGSVKALNFTKVIDSYEEPEEEETHQYDEKHWVDNYPGALECARWYRDLLARYYGEIPTKYFESYISLTVGGIARVWVNKRKNDRALIEVKYVEQDMGEAVDHLNREGIAFGTRSNKYLTFNVNVKQLKDKQTVHDWVIRQLAPQHLIKPKS
jgi:hypothetical protein